MKKKTGKVSGKNMIQKVNRKSDLKKKDAILSKSDQFSLERYRDFIESIDEGVYETDIHGNFTYFNDSLCDVFGYSHADLMGQNFTNFMEKNKARQAYGTFTKIWVTHKGFSGIYWDIIDKEGNERKIELSAHLIQNGAGKKTGFRGIARDVTEKFRTLKQLKETEELYLNEAEINRRSQVFARESLDFIPYPMVVSSLNGKVIYVNPAFTQVFGWELDEIRGKPLPHVPPGLEEETRKNMEQLLTDGRGLRIQTKRLTKDGRLLDVVIRGAIFSGGYGEKRPHQLVILRDVTEDLRSRQINEAILRISLALPSYPDLEDLLDYISEEIMNLLNCERALVMLLDEEQNELFFLGAADKSTKQGEHPLKKYRVPADKSIAGNVIKSGEPVIVPDANKAPDFYQGVGKKLGYQTEDLVYVPLKRKDKIIGVLSARNKKAGIFSQDDVNLLNMIAGTVSLSIENARFSRELQEAYNEVTSLNRAKDRVINHLSHELKTPVSVLLATLNILSKRLAPTKKEDWLPAMSRGMRNLNRIIEIQQEVEDIMLDKEYKAYHFLSNLLEQCTDELEVLIDQETGNGDLVRKIRERIDEIFGPKESKARKINLGDFVKERLVKINDYYAHRVIDIKEDMDGMALILIPEDVLQKLVDGVIKNAIENTPDDGKIEINVKKVGSIIEFQVHDYGIGITENNKKRIFEGFFITQETMNYSSKRPFDFNAGGKGADLLRMKIFSERFDFKISMESTRCGFIPEDKDLCPGEISRCSFCNQIADCYDSGETIFTFSFQAVEEHDVISQ